MSQDVQLQSEKRDTNGKRAAADLRAQGKVPASLQEHGKESISLVVDGPAMLRAYRDAGKNQPITLSVGSQKKLALIKQIEMVPLRPEVSHVVFQALKQDEPVDAEVPVHLVGDVPAEANRLVILHTLESLNVRALPKHLPESLEVDASVLAELDDKVTIGDIVLPEGVELVELLALADDAEKQAEFLAQPIALVKEPTVESTEGVELQEGESEADVVDAQNGGDTEQGGQTESDNPGGKKAKEEHGQ